VNKNINAPENPKSLWPYGIIGVYAVFIAALATYVTFALSNDVELVTKNYYQREIEHDAHMKRVKRTLALGDQVTVHLDEASQGLVLKLPPTHVTDKFEGRVQFYFPADAAQDQFIPLAIKENGTQEFHSLDLRSGLWRMKVSWESGSDEFHFEKDLNVLKNGIISLCPKLSQSGE
jgi:nitrogen fixation protein FixH